MALGPQLDPGTLAPSEREELRAWIALYKAERDLLHGGRLVHADDAEPWRLVKGVVASDRVRALFGAFQLGTSRSSPPSPIRFPSLDPDRPHRVRSAVPPSGPATIQRAPPAWMADGAGLRCPGRLLAETGLASPILSPESALVLAVEAVEP